ncbi:hypothetical protein [Armatimonas rosea]|uniref:Uncharacterized protein n=1 Tax=Armatimonas rosea TaxID=685828 RepID=A0A7W9W743_ARMRO|nr:hypothetical protein [Armatimonas rosea]MBB6050836.1 hypothetical protein [Armatimonas rosea]
MSGLAKKSLLVVAFVLTGLHFHPQTAWLIRTQWRVVFAGAGERVGTAALGNLGASLEERDQTVLTLAQQHPESVPVVLAAAFIQDDPKVAQRLCADLARRFPQEPAVAAGVLRAWLTRNNSAFLPHRPQDEAVLQRRSPPSAWQRRLISSPPQPPAGMVTPFLEQARHGEAIDPDNAFFPAMRAVALFTAHRDQEALQALHLAATKRRWDDYHTAMVQGRHELLTLHYGSHPALGDYSTELLFNFPDLGALRRASRLALVHAVRRELLGDLEGGFQIRRTLRTLVTRLRESGCLLLSPRTFMERPGGLPVAALDDVKERVRGAALRCVYLDYLRHIGHPEEATAVEGEQTAFRLARQQANEDARNLYLPLVGPLLTWGWSLVFLVGACHVLILGAIAALLQRTGRIRASLPAHPGVRAALWLVLGVLPLVAIALVSGALFRSWALYPAAGLGIFALAQLVRTTPRGRRWRSAGWLLAALAGLAALATLLYLPLSGALALRSAVLGSGEGCGCGEPDDEVATDTVSEPEAWVAGNSTAMTGTLCLPLALVAVLLVVSRVRRVPVTVGVVRGVARGSLPLFVALLIHHALATVLLVSQEATLRATALESSRR